MPLIFVMQREVRVVVFFFVFCFFPDGRQGWVGCMAFKRGKFSVLHFVLIDVCLL